MKPGKFEIIGNTTGQFYASMEFPDTAETRELPTVNAVETLMLLAIKPSANYIKESGVEDELDVSFTGYDGSQDTLTLDTTMVAQLTVVN